MDAIKEDKTVAGLNEEGVMDPEKLREMIRCGDF